MKLKDIPRASFPPLRRSLLAWFGRVARDLPWRRTRDPYRIWISEIMLQQTRVEGATPYYERFLDAFPTVESLASANPDRVMKLWEGLGYYSRARNLMAAARAVCGEREGRFPRKAEEWARLPGIGRYTAGAIASIAFGERVAALDGNGKRVLARLFRIEDPLGKTTAEIQLWQLAEALVPAAAPGAFNQSLMELGARVCLPRNPRCPECPVQKHCQAAAAGVAAELPRRAPKPALPHKIVVAAAIERGGKYLLGRRPAEGMLGGLWEFPGGKVEDGESDAGALRREIREELGVSSRIGDCIAEVNHAYSHFRVTLRLYRCGIPKGSEPRPLSHSALRWVSPGQFSRYAFPSANLKFLDKLRVPAKLRPRPFPPS